MCIKIYGLPRFEQSLEAERGVFHFVQGYTVLWEPILETEKQNIKELYMAQQGYVTKCGYEVKTGCEWGCPEVQTRRLSKYKSPRSSTPEDKLLNAP